MRRFVLLLSILLGMALIGPVAASPQPTPVCRFCGVQFEEAASAAGANVTVTASDVLIEVHEDGSATWTVRLSLGNGSEAFTGVPAGLGDAARELAADGYGLPAKPAFVDAMFEGDTAVLRYRDADAAERRAGLLVVDYLHDRGGQPWFHVNADRFTVRGPPGTAVVNAPESGRVADREVTWRGNGSGDTRFGPDLEGSPYVVFGPDRSAATRLRATAAVGLATLPILLDGISRYLVIQPAIFALLLGGVVFAFSRWDPQPPVEPLAWLIGGLGALGAAVPAVTNGPGWVSGPPLLALGLATVSLRADLRGRLRRPRGQALAVGGLLVASFVVLLGLHLVLASRWTNPPAVALRATAIAFPLAAMVPLGGALAVDPERIRPWFTLAVLGFVAVPLTVVNLVDPPSGLGAGLLAVGLLLGAAVAPIIGALGLALGRSLAGGDAATE